MEQKKGNLLFSEIEQATKFLFKVVQNESFSDENDNSIHHFQPFKDKDGIIRIKTKIILRDDTNNF